MSISYCSPYSILIHDRKSLKRLYCPFRVVISPSIGVSDQIIGEVIEIRVKEGIMHYLIDGIWHPYSLFEIL